MADATNTAEVDFPEDEDQLDSQQRESSLRIRLWFVSAAMATIVVGCFLMLGFSLKRNEELVGVLDRYRDHLDRIRSVANQSSEPTKDQAHVKRIVRRFEGLPKPEAPEAVFLRSPTDTAQPRRAPSITYRRRRPAHELQRKEGLLDSNRDMLLVKSDNANISLQPLENLTVRESDISQPRYKADHTMTGMQDDVASSSLGTSNCSVDCTASFEVLDDAPGILANSSVHAVVTETASSVKTEYLVSQFTSRNATGPAVSSNNSAHQTVELRNSAVASSEATGALESADGVVPELLLRTLNSSHETSNTTLAHKNTIAFPLENALTCDGNTTGPTNADSQGLKIALTVHNGPLRVSSSSTGRTPTNSLKIAIGKNSTRRHAQVSSTQTPVASIAYPSSTALGTSSTTNRSMSQEQSAYLRYQSVKQMMRQPPL